MSGDQGYLTGQLLIAMPTMRDPRFARSVVYLCAHNSDAAMGLVVNRLIGSLTFPDLLTQLGIDASGASDEIRVHFGGPVETGRGFVLHSTDYQHESSMDVDRGVALTATVEILRDMAKGSGPERSLLALGYAGWGPGQLESELARDSWVVVPAQTSLVFAEDPKESWRRAMASWGIDL